MDCVRRALNDFDMMQYEELFGMKGFDDLEFMKNDLTASCARRESSFGHSFARHKSSHASTPLVEVAVRRPTIKTATRTPAMWWRS